MCNIWDVTFVTWLDTELQQRDWTRSELARRTGFTHSAISHIYSGRRKPGQDMIVAIAKALDVPAEEVFAAAGVLPPKSPEDAFVARMEHQLEQITDPGLRKRAMQQIQLLIEEQEEIKKEKLNENYERGRIRP